MADIEKPITRYEYFIITTEKFPSYEEKIKYKRYLRRSVETPTLNSGEEMVKVAITTYPNNEPYELNTDPINLSGWDPLESTDPDVYKTWASCQDWLFYDDVNARDYEDPEGLVNDAKIGGFMRLEPTYFYYDSENKYQGSGTWNKRGENTAILTPPLVDGEIADPNEYDITWNGTDAWVIVKLPEKIIGYPEFTFVVDSNENLAAWIANASGHDYTSVLIRRGTWEGSGNINLTTTNTIAVFGEPESILNLNGFMTCSSNVYRDDLHIENVTIKRAVSGGTYTIAFRYLSNLLNCKAIIDVDANTIIYGYEGCHRINNCTSDVTNANSGSRGTFGFYASDWLVNCRAYAYRTLVTTNNISCHAYNNCSHLSLCYALAYSNASGTYGEGHGYHECSWVTGCIAITGANSVNGGGRGFWRCSQVESCTTLPPDSSYTNIGLDFYDCTSVHNCKAGSGSSEPYRNVYASSTTDNNYLAADTPNGGWNS